MSKNNILHISVSSYSDFMTCRRLYFYKRIKKYERSEFNIPFVVGKVVHYGMEHIFKKASNAIERTVEYFRKEKAEINKTFILTEKQSEQLNEQEIVTQGMLKAYRKKYAAMIRDMKVLGTEVEGSVMLEDDVAIVVKLDNLVSIKERKILHELKTTKYLTPDYVKRIQTDKQTAFYFHFYNVLFEKKPIKEVMYDVIRKPSIRQKQSESKQQYLQRLEEWYDMPDSEGNKFHIERFKEPKIGFNALLESVSGVAADMKRCKHKEDYYQDFDKCTSYYGDICPYYALCHEGGETKENLVLYQIRKSYHVDKSNKQGDV